MAAFSRIDVVLRMKESGIIPVFYHPDPEICIQVLSSCYNGGLKIFEFTNRAEFAQEVFSEIIKYSRQNFPDMIVGAGSIVDPGTTSLYIQTGADFIVSPVVNPEMAKICNRRKICWSPGCGSLNEISFAEELGAEVVKIFPGSQVGGPAFVKAVRGPCPWTSIMPTGGVEPSEENLGAWFDAGVHCVGMGSKLITKEIIADRDFVKLETKVREAVKLVDKIRNEP